MLTGRTYEKQNETYDTTSRLFILEHLVFKRLPRLGGEQTRTISDKTIRGLGNDISVASSPDLLGIEDSQQRCRMLSLSRLPLSCRSNRQPTRNSIPRYTRHWSVLTPVKRIVFFFSAFSVFHSRCSGDQSPDMRFLAQWRSAGRACSLRGG